MNALFTVGTTSRRGRSGDAPPAMAKSARRSPTYSASWTPSAPSASARPPAGAYTWLNLSAFCGIGARLQVV